MNNLWDIFTGKHKIKHLLAIAIYVAFSIAAIFMIRFFKKGGFVFFCTHFHLIVIAQIVITFLLGMLLNSVHKKLIFSFQPYYLTVSLVCLLLIIPLYTCYEYIPIFFKINLDYIQSFLSLYAGANFFSALFGQSSKKTGIPPK